MSSTKNSKLYKVDMEVINTGYIDFSKTPITKKELEELPWVDAVNFLNTYAETHYEDTRDWNLYKVDK